MNRVVDAAVSEFGGIDVVVNNVGLGKGADLEGTTDADWQEALDQTLFPAIRMSRGGRAAPAHSSGGGAIVIISSIFGREAGGRMTYNAVKAAEISLAKSLAQQLAKDQIRVVSVAPGSILFEGGSWWKRQQADPEGIAEFVKQRAAVRPLRHARRSRRRRRVSRVAEGQLDQRHDRRRRRLPVADVLAPPIRSHEVPQSLRFANQT